nr:hypothetical protein CFP56_09022 [Quercus suber]
MHPICGRANVAVTTDQMNEDMGWAATLSICRRRYMRGCVKNGEFGDHGQRCDIISSLAVLKMLPLSRTSLGRLRGRTFGKNILPNMSAANMEPYQKSVQSVDAALNRLRATLASYKMSGAKTGAISNGGHDTSKGTTRSPTAPPQAHSAANANAPAGKRSVSAHPTSLVQQQSAAPHDPVWQEVLTLRAGCRTRQITKAQVSSVVAEVKHTYDLLEQRPYCLPLYIILAQKQLQLGYPDLVACAAYKALLLSDSVQDQADEYHEEACDALREVVLQQSVHERISLLKGELHGEGSAGPGVEHDVEVDLWLRKHYERLMYVSFRFKSSVVAHTYAAKGLKLFPKPPFFLDAISVLKLRIAELHKVTFVEVTHNHPPSTWPDKGFVRREHYPWNTYEPDRYKDLDVLNTMMAEVAPKLEIRAVQLPALTGDTSDIVTQLGVFAKESIAPGEAILQETSLLTANNKLQDALCDACSSDLPPLDSEAAQSIVSCPDCEVVFCSSTCYEDAMEQYHPALCDRDVEAIAKDVPPAEAADSLYALLLLRALAMAETQAVHPLDLPAAKYIWADFTRASVVAADFVPPTTDPFHATTDPVPHALPRTLPFSFDANVRLPLHMLEKMDVNVFTAAPQYDGWVFNTLYAKFRGTASARLSGLGGRAVRGPEVSAVHPMWCMANHSCDPNVSWEWGGSVRFWAREERVAWAIQGEGGQGVRSLPGLRKGDEVLNHYCDVELGVQERREWARGSLGGDCMCTRCVYEARALEKAQNKT